MTYTNASSWADGHISKDDYNCFEDWLNDATANREDGLGTPSLLNEPEYINDMRRYWMDEVGSNCRDEELEEPDIEPEREEIPIPASQKKDIQIDNAFIVSSKGIEPARIVDIKTDDSPPVVITESEATARPVSEPTRERLAQSIPRVNIQNRISNVATRLRAIGSDILGFLRRR